MNDVIDNRVLNAFPALTKPGERYYIKKNGLVVEYLIQNDGTPIPVSAPDDIVVQVGGQFLLDPGEYNGWGPSGYIDDTNNFDLGNVGATNLRSLAGGIMFPFDVRIKRFMAVHYNSSFFAEGWGWCIFRQSKPENGSANTLPTTFMLDEAFDRGTGQFNIRDYINTNEQKTDITNFVNDVIPAGEVITLCVGAPDAPLTNYYVRILAGIIEFDRIL